MAATHEDRNAQLSPGVAIKAPCRVATTSNITLNGEQTIDGIAAISGDRVLVKNQTNQTANGIYLVSTSSWTREPDFDGNRDVVLGSVVKVVSGAVGAGWWGVTTVNPITFGSSNIIFAQDLVSDSSTISFTQSGVGAVARTVQSKERDAPKSPTEFASGIQQAVNASSGGGVVKIPAGTTASAAAITGLSSVTLQGDSKTTSLISFSTANARGLDLSNALRTVVKDVTLIPPVSPTNLAIYADKSQELTFERVKAAGWDGGFQFLGTGGLVNIDWFNNIIVLDEVTAIQSLTRPNLDWQGLNLMCRGGDFSGLPPAGTRAAIRIRAGSYDSTFENTYYEHGTGTAGGNVFQCEGGVTRIKGGFAVGGNDGTKRVGNYISASGGAIVIVEGITGFNFWSSLVTADGAGTVVYVMPGTFTGSFDVTTRYVETNGGKVVDLTTTDAKTTDVAFSAGNFTGDGTITWTLDAGDQLVYNYMQIGKIMTVNWFLQTTSTGGAASGVLNIKIPNGKTAAKRTTNKFAYNDNGVLGNGVCDVLAGTTNIRLLKDLNATNWSNVSVNATSVAGQLSFEVQ